MYFKFYLRVFSVALVLSLTSSEPTGAIKPCKKDDDACILKAAKEVFPKFIEGFPVIGVPKLDPLPIDVIVGDLSTLKYKLNDSEVDGLANCTPEKVKLDIDSSKLSFILECQDIHIKGLYEISGRLIVLPIEGKGDYSIDIKRYIFNIEADLKETKDQSGTAHIAIKKYKIISNPEGGIIYDFRNLFNGQKELGDTVIRFANENWKEVADFVQEPVVSAIFKKLMKHLNTFLKVIPIEELYQN